MLCHVCTRATVRVKSVSQHGFNGNSYLDNATCEAEVAGINTLLWITFQKNTFASLKSEGGKDTNGRIRKTVRYTRTQ